MLKWFMYTPMIEYHSALFYTKKRNFFRQLFSKVLEEIWVWEETKNLRRWNVDFSKSESFPTSVIKRY